MEAGLFNTGAAPAQRAALTQHAARKVAKAPAAAAGRNRLGKRMGVRRFSLPDGWKTIREVPQDRIVPWQG